jgi:hypothetical protein
MMGIEEVVNRMQELGSKASLSSSENMEIERWYYEALGKTFHNTSCGDCYRDAAIEIYLYLKRNGKMKEKSNYGLKNGILLQLEFGSSNFYTNANLTDEVAETYLAKHPSNIKMFSVYPKDWEDRVKSRVLPAPVINDELVHELVNALKVEGATDKTVKNSFKTYQIDGNKVTSKVLDVHIKEAKSRLEEENSEIVKDTMDEGTEDKVE